jgi:uncharacterized integral membrane protein
MEPGRLFRNLWMYRRAILAAVLLGLLAAFVLLNRQEVEVRFPLLGTVKSSAGVVMLLSGALGAAIVWLLMTLRHLWERGREGRF